MNGIIGGDAYTGISLRGQPKRSRAASLTKPKDRRTRIRLDAGQRRIGDPSAQGVCLKNAMLTCVENRMPGGMEKLPSSPSATEAMEGVSIGYRSWRPESIQGPPVSATGMNQNSARAISGRA